MHNFMFTEKDNKMRLTLVGFYGARFWCFHYFLSPQCRLKCGRGISVPFSTKLNCLFRLAAVTLLLTREVVGANDDHTEGCFWLTSQPEPPSLVTNWSSYKGPSELTPDGVLVYFVVKDVVTKASSTSHKVPIIFTKSEKELVDRPLTPQGPTNVSLPRLHHSAAAATNLSIKIYRCLWSTNLNLLGQSCPQPL